MLAGNASSFRCAGGSGFSDQIEDSAWSFLQLLNHTQTHKNRNSWFTSHCEFEVVLSDFLLGFAGENILGMSPSGGISDELVPALSFIDETEL